MTTTIKIEKIISNGYGIGWTDKKTWFVPHVIDGEVVEVTRFKKIKKVFYAEEFTIITPSPHRIEPICPNFTLCGGCDFLHIDYAHQLTVKQEILRDHFRQNKIESLIPADVKTVHPSKIAHRTRAKVVLKDGKGAFYGKKSHDIYPFENCPLLDKSLNKIISKHAQRKSGEIRFELSADSKEWIPQKEKIERKVFDQRLVQSEGSFFQSSEEAAELLVALFNSVLDTIDPQSMVDLYCGIGLFTAFARKRGIKTISVENSPVSTLDFKENLPKRTLLQIKAENWNPKTEYDLVVVDPPRSGLPPQLITTIHRATKNLLYISCDAATFARDAKILMQKEFVLQELTLLDLFPATRHFEVAGMFVRS